MKLELSKSSKPKKKSIGYEGNSRSCSPSLSRLTRRTINSFRSSSPKRRKPTHVARSASGRKPSVTPSGKKLMIFVMSAKRSSTRPCPYFSLPLRLWTKFPRMT